VLEISHIVALFHINYPKNNHFPGHVHDAWEFIYVNQGQTEITAGEKEYLLKSGELAFHMPGEFHAVRAYKSTAANVIVAKFVCASPAMRHFENRITALSAKEREFIYESMRLYRQFCLNLPADAINCLSPKMPPVTAQLIRDNLELLLVSLIHRNESVSIQERADSLAQIVATEQLTARVTEYLAENITKKITLKQIATDLGYSISQIKKFFRKEKNQGVIDYFIDMKVVEAERMLKEGKHSIAYIAETLGFSDAAYFSRVFKQREGITPSEYARTP